MTDERHGGTGESQLPRLLHGRPVPNFVSHRMLSLLSTVAQWAPALADWLVEAKAQRLAREAFGSPDASWWLGDAPSTSATSPLVSDVLLTHLRSGAVQSLPAVERFCGANQVLLRDGRRIEADAVIFCTGYKADFAILGPRYDPAAEPSLGWLMAPGSRGRPLPRLYQNVFSLRTASSLAFVGCVWFATGAFMLADISSMCIAQVWTGKSSLPSPADMQCWTDRQERRIVSLAQQGTVIPASVEQRAWLAWADRAAGMGVEARLGWGWDGWRFWWTERTLWRMLVDGVRTSVVWRLFDGKRKRWPGARQEIVRANEDASSSSRAGGQPKRD